MTNSDALDSVLPRADARLASLHKLAMPQAHWTGCPVHQDRQATDRPRIAMAIAWFVLRLNGRHCSGHFVSRTRFVSAEIKIGKSGW